MKIKHLLLSTLLCVGTMAMAQQVTVGEAVKVSTPSPAYHPTFTPDGASLLTTSEDYTGLQQTVISTGVTTNLSSQRRAGLKSLRATNAAKSVNGTDLKINIVENGTVTVLTPNGEDERYLWPALSPSGDRLAYTVSGKGSFVLDLATGRVSFVGKLRAPQWLDNNYLVAMNDSDDGYKVTASNVVLSNAAGTFSQTVSPEGMIAMYPCATTGRIAFNTLEGEIYIMNINITE